MFAPPFPTMDDVREGHRVYQEKEPREAMYRTASFLVDHFWGKPRETADSLGVLLLTWNSAFYRQGSFDFDELEEVVASEQTRLVAFRAREILGYLPSEDGATVTRLFERLLVALRICEKANAGSRSPVAVTKALHLLAPRFFPPWDRRIAAGYGCAYDHAPAEKYLLFLTKIKQIVEQLVSGGATDEEMATILKLVDEYNYVRFTLPAEGQG